MRTRILAVIVALCAVTAPIAVAQAPSHNQKHTYLSLYKKAQRMHGRRAPGRNIVRDGVKGGRAASAERVVKSIHTLRSMTTTVAAVAQAASNVQASQVSTPVQSSPSAGSGGGGGSGLQAIAQCESGGNPSAVSPDGQYRGKYQFDYGTWASIGGRGDPAAAPEAEQDALAGALQQQRGNSPWPNCG